MEPDPIQQLFGFAGQCYRTFDSALLTAMHQSSSRVSYEGVEAHDAEEIVHLFQAKAPTQHVLVKSIGNLLKISGLIVKYFENYCGGGEGLFYFSQTFLLPQVAPNNFFVQQSIFRMGPTRSPGLL
ncbi:HIG1 domain-containing protein [Psidium guajava]|nr:HIG1 domain-containing protein [Psidium guajava]